MCPYPEFLGWVEYYRREADRNRKEDFYAAGLRLEIVRLRRTVVSIFKKLTDDDPTLENYLLVKKGEGEQPSPVKSGYRPGDDGYTAMSKAAWGAAIGLPPSA